MALAGLHSLDFWEGTAASSVHTWQDFQGFPEIPFAGFSNHLYLHGICPLGLSGISLAKFIVSGSTTESDMPYFLTEFVCWEFASSIPSSLAAPKALIRN